VPLYSRYTTDMQIYCRYTDIVQMYYRYTDIRIWFWVWISGKWRNVFIRIDKVSQTQLVSFCTVHRYTHKTGLD